MPPNRWETAKFKTMAQTISMIFDKFDVRYWLDYGKNSFLSKQEGSKGEGGEGSIEKRRK